MGTGIFNSIAKSAFDHQFEQLKAAIQKQDIPAIDVLMAEVVQSETYSRGKYKQTLVQAALDTDNKDILMKVLEGKPDFTFSYAVSDSSLSLHTESLLYKALKEQRQNIAMFLAQHPAVDISAGSNKYGMGYSEKNTPTDIACDRGIQSVADILDKRKGQAPMRRSASGNRPGQAF